MFTGEGQSSQRVRDLVVEAVEVAAGLIESDAIAEAWDGPSALEGMTVGALAAHLVRAAGATIAYLDRTPPEQSPEGELLTAVTYFHAAVDSPIHEQVKAVSKDEASAGHAAVAEKSRTLAKDLKQRLAQEPPDRLVGALGGRMLTLDDFCRTRLIEVLLHLDDLAVSVGFPRPETDPEGIDIVTDIILGIARDNRGPWAILHAMARSERAPEPPVFPVF